MLVLSRQRDESIVIGNPETHFVQLTSEELGCIDRLLKTSDVPTPTEYQVAIWAVLKRLVFPIEPIEVTVVSIQERKARIGIKAPPILSVHRREVYNAIRRGEVQR